MMVPYAMYITDANMLKRQSIYTGVMKICSILKSYRIINKFFLQNISVKYNYYIDESVEFYSVSL
jgi:hypothetical protein